MMQVDEMPVPEIGPRDVLIKVAYCGVCGTDVDAYVGKQPRGWTITYPFRMGHELAGTVVAVGSEVPTVAVGDGVVPDGRLTCGYCYYCRRGMWSACQNAGYFSGGLSEYAAYPFANLVKVPDGVSLEEAAFAEPLACVVNGQAKVDVAPGAIAAVIGDGPIGMMHAQMLRHRGAYTVMIGLLDHRLAVAEQLGINRVVNASRDDPIAAVAEVSSGRGADVVVNAAGKVSVLKQAIDLAARQGHVLYFAATLAPEVTLDLDLVHYKELRLVGSYDSTIAQYEDALALIRAGAVQVMPLITHRFGIGQVKDGFEVARRQEGLKVQVAHAA
jgi:2-desacetyl-2-hydroxyethyl bacteriochlorophyllide A dehydrogenase